MLYIPLVSWGLWTYMLHISRFSWDLLYYTLWSFSIAIGNWSFIDDLHWFILIHLLNMVIFHSYLSLAEGNSHDRSQNSPLVDDGFSPFCHDFPIKQRFKFHKNRYNIDYQRVISCVKIRWESRSIEDSSSAEFGAAQLWGPLPCRCLWSLDKKVQKGGIAHIKSHSLYILYVINCNYNNIYIYYK